MASPSIEQIEEQLRRLPPEKLAVVLDFVSYLADLSERQADSAALQTMLASEASMRKDWDRPEEDAAWADL